MADHDRYAGPRGDEEAPRGPNPEWQDWQLKYGERADQPYADIPPTQPMAAWETPDESGRARRRRIVGVGLAGLLAGVLIGGFTVAAVTDAMPPGRFGVWYGTPHWLGNGSLVIPKPPKPTCWESGEEVRCTVPQPPRLPSAPDADEPRQTFTG
jgi:hypothetical protein